MGINMLNVDSRLRGNDGGVRGRDDEVRGNDSEMFRNDNWIAVNSTFVLYLNGSNTAFVMGNHYYE